MESTAVQCSLQCTYMTHSPRCQRVIPTPRTHSLTHINCCSYAVICTIYVAEPVCKKYSIRNIVPDFYFEGFKGTGFLFFPLKKKEKKFDSCVDGIKLFKLSELPRALFPTAHVHFSMFPRHSQLSQVGFLRKTARVRSDLGSVLSVLAAAVSVSGGERHRRLSVRPTSSSCAAPRRANGSPLE